MKIQVSIFAALISCLGFTILPSRAENSAGDALRIYDKGNKETREMLELIITETQNGASWTNAILIRQKKQPLYCTPPNLVFTASQLVDIIRRAIKEDQDQDLSKYPLGMVLLVSLQRVFPCQQQPN